MYIQVPPFQISKYATGCNLNINKVIIQSLRFFLAILGHIVFLYVTLLVKLLRCKTIQVFVIFPRYSVPGMHSLHGYRRCVGDTAMLGVF